MPQPSVLGIVLAGGAGTRLSPLTADRAKPAVPFGGLYRLIDFALSNLANGRILKMCVLTQYKSHSLDRHISTTWRMSALLGNYVTPVPAQQRLGPYWYTGSAGFSRNASTLLPSGPTLTMPNAEASCRGTGMAATVTPAPWVTWWSIICWGSIRYTWSAPTTTTRSGFSSLIRFIDWKIASAEPVYQCGPSRCCAGTGVT